MADVQLILWDFDGVLMNSNEVRDMGFLEVLRSYPAEQVEELMRFHKNNGGLSRYVKFRFFFEQVRGEDVTNEKINELAEAFSVIMLKLLTNTGLLIAETMEFVRRNYLKIPMHIVSGSDQKELRYLCESMDIAKYFKSINGSPTPKKTLVKQVLEHNHAGDSKVLLIGDSTNDYDAAKDNNTLFMAYNNPAIEHLSDLVIDLAV